MHTEMAPKPLLQAEKIFYALGPIGRYQCLHLFVVSLGVFPALIQLLDNVFIGASVEHQCAGPHENSTSSVSLPSIISRQLLLGQDNPDSTNHSLTFDKCHIRVKGTTGSVVEEIGCVYGYEYDGPRTQSVVSQLDLVCDKKQLLRVTQTLVFAGQAVGAVVGPFFSDRFGRKPTLVLSEMAMLVVGMIIAFAPNYIVFAISKFVIGALQQSVYIPVSIITGELLPTNYRRYSIIINTVTWGVAGVTMTLVAFLMQDVSWRYLQAVLSLSALVFIVHLCVLDESLMWLIANGKEDKAIKCIKKAALWNSQDPETVLKAGYSRDSSTRPKEYGEVPDSNQTKPMLSDNKAGLNGILNEPPQKNGVESHNGSASAEKDVQTTQKMSFIHILRIRRLFINAVAMWVTWFSASLCYFTLYLMVSTLAGDRYLNYLLTSLMDIPACIIFFFGFNRYGRRSVTILLYSILAVGTFTLGLLRHFADDEHSVWSALTLVTSLISIVGGSGCFFSIFFYLPELFPTNLRNQATGYASCFARIGAMISPFMGALASVAIWAPGLVMCAFASVAVFLLLLLPETKNKQLPQSIAEMESWFEKDKSKAQVNLDKTTQAIV